MNFLWGGFFILGISVACLRWMAGDDQVFQEVAQSTFEMARLAVEIAIGLIGLLALWSGLFRIAEQSGLIAIFSRALEPLFARLMPEVPRGHAAQGAVTMNLAANMLGLDNAATPLGLKAMQSLQELNPTPQRASDAQILFLVLNTSSVTLLPVTIFMYRAQLGAADPTEVFIPILLATSTSTLVGLVCVMLVQRIRLDAVLMIYLGGLILALVAFILWLGQLPEGRLSAVSQVLANGVLLAVIGGFVGYGMWRGVRVYEEFIEGAKSGFETAIKILPYLVAMLVAIGILRASGVLEYLIAAIVWVLHSLGLSSHFADALPVAFMKPFSGSGARAMMLEVMNAHGVDSLAGRLAAVMQGSTETTFYVLTLYFGVVGITRIRYALWCGLLCDVAGMVTAIFLGMWFFG